MNFFFFCSSHNPSFYLFLFFAFISFHSFYHLSSLSFSLLFHPPQISFHVLSLSPFLFSFAFHFFSEFCLNYLLPTFYFLPSFLFPLVSLLTSACHSLRSSSPLSFSSTSLVLPSPFPLTSYILLSHSLSHPSPIGFPLSSPTIAMSLLLPFHFPPTSSLLLSQSLSNLSPISFPLSSPTIALPPLVLKAFLSLFLPFPASPPPLVYRS